jgi:hypothetical protein
MDGVGPGRRARHARPDPFAFVTALVEVALAAGARAAAVLPGFLEGVAQDSTDFRMPFGRRCSSRVYVEAGGSPLQRRVRGNGDAWRWHRRATTFHAVQHVDVWR